MRNSWYILVLWWAGCSSLPTSVLWCQASTWPVRALPKINHIDLADGLPSRQVHSVTQDTDGFMWVSTQLGLCRFDGRTFLPLRDLRPQGDQAPAEPTRLQWLDADILALLSIDGARLWLYDIRNNLLQEPDLPFGEGRFQPLTAYPGSDRSLWLPVTYPDAQVLMRYQPETGWQTVDSIPYTERRRQYLLQSGEQEFYWLLVGQGIRHYSSTGQLIQQRPMPDTFPRVFYLDAADQLYVQHTATDPIHQWLDPTQVITQAPLLAPRPMVAHTDHAGRQWTYLQYELLRIGPDMQIESYYQSLKDRLDRGVQVRDVYEDRQHRIWLATNAGLVTFANLEPIFYPYLQHEQPQWGIECRGIFDDAAGHLYVRTTTHGNLPHRSFYRIDTRTGQAALMPFQFGGPPERLLIGARYFQRLPGTDTVITFGTRGMFQLALSDSMLYHTPLSDLGIQVAGRRVGWAWAPPYGCYLSYTGTDMHHLDLRTYQATPMALPDSLAGVVRCMVMGADSTLWLGTSSGEVVQIDLRSLDSKWISTSHDFPTSSISSLYPHPAGDCWVGTTTQGLWQFPAAGGSPTVRTTTDGLANDQVMELLPYGEDYLLISTFHGLSLLHLPDQTFRNFYEEDGLSHNEFNVSSAYIDAQDRYWLGGLNGVNAFAPTDLLRPRLPPAPLLFTRFQTYDARSDTLLSQRTDLSTLQRIVLNPYISWFQVDFALADYATSPLNRFRTRLLGYQENWEDIGSNTSIRYNDLPAGRYQLQITGADGKGFWSDQPLALDIVVREVFYRTLWFFLLVTAGVASLIWAFLRYRFRQKLAQARIRTQIASDLHDEVGSSLSHVSLLLHAIDVEQQPPHLARGLVRGREVVHRTVGMIRDVAWAVDARRDTLGDLLDRMNDFALDFLLAKGIQYTLHAEPLPSRQLPLNPILRQNLYLIFKEAIHNVVRHSSATAVTTRFFVKDRHWHLRIADNGSPKTNGGSSGLGLDNMRLRAKRIGGQLIIEQDERGFCVALKVGV